MERGWASLEGAEMDLGSDITSGSMVLYGVHIMASTKLVVSRLHVYCLILRNIDCSSSEDHTLSRDVRSTQHKSPRQQQDPADFGFQGLRVHSEFLYRMMS